jgi:phage tail-like protein
MSHLTHMNEPPDQYTGAPTCSILTVLAKRGERLLSRRQATKESTRESEQEMLRSARLRMWMIAAALLAALAAVVVSVSLPDDTAQAQVSSGFWSVEVQDVGSGNFSDVEGVGTSLAVVQTQVQGSRLNVKSAGRGSASNILLSRRLTEDMSFYNWHRQVVANGTSGTRKTGTITYFDGSGTVASFEFTNGWPARYAVTELQSGSVTVLIEEITLAVDDLKRVS